MNKIQVGVNIECNTDTWSVLVKEYRENAIQLRKIISNDQLVIIKRFQEDETWDLSRNMFENEVKAYILLANNSYVGKLYKTLRCEEKGDMMVLEYLGDISADQYVRNLNVIGFLHFFRLLATVIESFEALQINHGDFHLGNVNIVNGNIKVFDFGLSRGPHFLPSNWGGNIVFTRTSKSQEQYILGQDLHDFIVLYFVLRSNIVPQVDFKKDLIDKLNLISEEKYNQRIPNPDYDDNYTKIQHHGKKIYVLSELTKNHSQTSGRELALYLQKQIYQHS